MKNRHRKKVCFIQPPVSFRNPKGCLPSEYVGIGLLALSAFLEREGFDTGIYHFPNALAEGHTPRRVFQEISLFRPGLFAVGMNWVHFSSGAVEVAARLKEFFPDTRVVVGGHHASLFAAEIAGGFPEEIDALIVGEAELPLLEIARRPANATLDDIPGVFTANNFRSACPAEVVGDIDSLPFHSFRRVWPQYRKPMAAVDTMRGSCPHQCIYCLEGSPHVHWKRGRPALHSIDRIVEQIHRYRSEGKNIITIEDQFSLRGDRGAAALAEGLRARGAELAEFNLFAEPGSYSPEGLEALASVPADVVTMDYGIETGSPDVAREARLSFKTRGFLDQVSATTGAGILPFTWWMLGFPGEGPEELEQTREFILETMALGAIPRWVTPLVLFPQTEMAVRAADYAVSVRMKSFADFLRFSIEPENEWGCYPSLMTHGTDRMPPGRIAEESLKLKKAIIDNWGLIEDFYKNHPVLREKYRRRTIMLGTEKEDFFTLSSFF